MRKPSPGNVYLDFPGEGNYRKSRVGFSGEMPAADPALATGQQPKDPVGSLILQAASAAPTPFYLGLPSNSKGYRQGQGSGSFQFPLNPGPPQTPQPVGGKNQGKKRKGAPNPQVQSINPSAQSAPYTSSIVTRPQPRREDPAPRPKSPREVDAIKKLIFGNTLGMGLPQPGYRPTRVHRQYVT